MMANLPSTQELLTMIAHQYPAHAEDEILSYGPVLRDVSLHYYAPHGHVYAITSSPALKHMHILLVRLVA